MTLVAVATGYLLAGRALRPLRAITATAQRVSGENLGERIALQGPADELRELADTFDGMLGRLDGAFASQRHFVANASHELRTPLAIMRTEVDVALADPDASRAELREMGEAVRDTVDRCERLIASLLTLARREAVAGRGEPVDLAALAGDCITDLRARAHEAGVSVADDLAPAWTQAEPALAERLVANLLDNAIRHNVPGGFVEVSTRTIGDRVQLRVVNGGERIDPAEAAGLTEPFRRRNRAVSGSAWASRSCARWPRRTGGRCASAPGRRGVSRSRSRCPRPSAHARRRPPGPALLPNYERSLTES